MSIFDDIKIFLPKYLSAESQEKLFEELGRFPENIDSRLYTSHLKHSQTLYQGDGIAELQFADAEKQEFLKVKGIVVSNTCDTDPVNKRNFIPYVTFAPLFRLKVYEEKLKAKKAQSEWSAVDNHIDSIRKQKVTQFFFLPAFDKDHEDLFARLDILQSVSTKAVSAEAMLEARLFTLSDYGFYLFLLKLSLHFSRIQESVDRGVLPKTELDFLKI